MVILINYLKLNNMENNLMIDSQPKNCVLPMLIVRHIVQFIDWTINCVYFLAICGFCKLKSINNT